MSEEKPSKYEAWLMKKLNIQDRFNSVVAYYPWLFKVTHDLNATLLLSQLIFLSYSPTQGQGEVFHNTEAFKAETNLTYKQQVLAREKLRKAGLISFRLKEFPPQYHYRVNFEALESQLKSLPIIDLSGILRKVNITNGNNPETVTPIMPKGKLHYLPLGNSIVYLSATPLKENLKEIQKKPKQETSSSSANNNGTDRNAAQVIDLGGGGGSTEFEEYSYVLKEIGIFKNLHQEYMRIAKDNGITPEGVKRIAQGMQDKGMTRDEIARRLKTRLKNPEPTASDDYTNTYSDDGNEADDPYRYFDEMLRGSRTIPANDEFNFLLDEVVYRNPHLQTDVAAIADCDVKWAEHKESGAKWLFAFVANKFVIEKYQHLSQLIRELLVSLEYDYDFELLLL